MSDFDLYYWPVPFRGQFIRGILAHAECTWDEHDAAEIERIMGHDPDKQPIGFMGPPLLIDRKQHFATSQMPAIAIYLGERLNLLPTTAQGRALCAKIVLDANDVLDELTLDGGRDMWTAKSWENFVPRLQKWIKIFESTGTRNGLTGADGFILGTEQLSIADIVASILWTTVADRFPAIGKIIEETSPDVWGHARRVAETPSLARLSRKSFDDYGETYCGGEIEKSLRSVAI